MLMEPLVSYKFKFVWFIYSSDNLHASTTTARELRCKTNTAQVACGCGRATCALERTGCVVSPRLIFGQLPLLPGCVASTEVLLRCSVKALKTQGSHLCEEGAIGY